MDWDRLARQIRERRLSLGLAQAEVAERARLTPVTVSRLENSHPAKTRTLWKLDRGLAWKPGSAERILGGGEPIVMPSPSEVYTDADEAAIWAITDLPEERRREWIAQLRQNRSEP